jgi:hypothetical protein
MQHNSFNLALLVGRYLREEVARPEVPPSIPPGAKTDSMTFILVDLTEPTDVLQWLKKMRKQSTAASGNM